MKPEELEEVNHYQDLTWTVSYSLSFQIKIGIVKFLGYGVFADKDILIHLIVAASDTRFTVANLADTELKKVVG